MELILCTLVIFTASYFVTAFLWGIYAIEQQRKCHPTTSLLKYFLVFIVNTIFMPICIMMAILRKD